MAKDCNGVELRIGDKITHLWGSWPRGEGAKWGDFECKMREMGIDKSKYLMSDGFDGEAKVTYVHSGSVEVDNAGMRGRIPVFASSYCRKV